MARDDQRDLTPVDAAERFISKRRNEDTDNTVRSHKERLRQFVAWCEEQEEIETMRDLDGWFLDDYERYLQERGNAPATVKGKMSSVRVLLKYCVSIEVLPEDMPDKITLPRLSKDEQTSDKKLDTEDAKALLEFYRDSTKHYGTVQHILLELIWHIGGRISCFQALDLDDWYPEERKIEFRHRPPTRLKDGQEHERNVIVPEEVAAALNFWIERERPKKRDDNGRTPLLTTNQGRASESTIRCWAYLATQPCVYTACPHNRRRETCDFTRRHASSKCPSSRAPHAIRTGSITWQLNRGLSYVKVAERVAASPETIRRYYDKADLDDELARRRPDTEHLDILHSGDDEDE